MLKFKSIHEANAALDALADGQRVEVLGRIAVMDLSLGALRFKCEQQAVKAQPDRSYARASKNGHSLVTVIGG